MLRKFTLIKVSLLLIFLIFVFLYSGVEKRDNRNEARSGGVFRIKSFTDEFRPELDPSSANSYIFISEQIYDGLVRLDKNLNVLPSLAEYWKISSDGKRYRFYLRKGAYFHHGGEITADDVKFSLERLLDRKTNSPYFQFFLTRVVGAREFREGKVDDVEGFKVLDKYTFEIYWTRPFISALYLLSMHFCKILPRDLILERGRDFFQRPSGTGPFKFDYWIRTPYLERGGVRLKRNDDYFLGKPYLNAVEFSPLYTLDQFFNGEIDSIPVLSERMFRRNYQIFQDNSMHHVFLGMSCHIAPLDNSTVRRAIAHAINKEEVARLAYDIRTVKQRTNSYIPSRLPGFLPPDDESTFDQEKARELLREAGFSAEREFPELRFFLEAPRTEAKMRIFREIREKLEVLGIRVNLDFYDSPEEIKRHREPYLFLIERSMKFPDPEDIVRPLFFSKSIFDHLGYANSVLDNLLFRSEVEKSWTKRIKLFHQMEEILIRDMPAVPLFSQQHRVAMQPYVRGVEWKPLGLYYLEARKIWLDK